MMIDDIGPTKPEAGVMATSPATAPLAAPSTVGFPRITHSAYIHDKVAAPVAVLVATNALVANAPDVRALPALKPNQPTHNMAAPMTENGRLCGGICSCGYPSRFPMTN